MRLSGDQIEALVASLLGPGPVGPGGVQRAGAPLAPGGLPQRIDRYRIMRRIGSGAMGVVYEADDEAMRRQVAIKVLSHHVGTEGLHWFRQEVRILGRLDHPGIASIFDSGTLDLGDGARPYFVMELVEGRPITEHMKLETPSTRERLALLEQLCDAVQHAHGRGIIHRDLKPANILVVHPRGEGGMAPGPRRVKVLDFGVARITDADLQLTTLHSDADSVIGTVPYMSPEQLSGDQDALDFSSDVYGLGIVMYEVLTGRLPYELGRQHLAEVARLVAEREPKPVGHLRPELRGDVSTIVARAMAKQRSRRYQTAGELGADLRRFLEHRPIEARPPSVTYWFGRFVRRNRVPVASLVAVFAVLIGALIAVSLSLRRSVRAEDEALRTVDALLVLAERLAGQVGALDERRSAVELIRTIAEEQLRRSPRSPEARDHMAAALKALGDLELESGRRGRARELFEAALELRRALAEEKPGDSEYAAALSIAIVRLGDVAKDEGDVDGGLARYLEALKIDEALAERHPGDLTLLDNLGWSYERVANMYGEHRGDFAAALPWHERRHAVVVRLVGLEPESLRRQVGLVNSHHLLGYCSGNLLRRATARAHCREALDLARRLVASAPEIRLHQQSLIWAARGLAATLDDDDDDDERARILDEAIDACRVLMKREPRNPAHLQTAISLVQHRDRLGGGLDEGHEALAREVVERSRALVREEPERMALRDTLAHVVRTARHVLPSNVQDGHRLLEEAVTLTRTLVEQRPGSIRYRLELAKRLGELARLAADLGRLDDARRHLTEGLALVDAVLAGAPDRITAHRDRLWILECGSQLPAEAGDVLPDAPAGGHGWHAARIESQRTVAELTRSPVEVIALARLSVERSGGPAAGDALRLVRSIVAEARGDTATAPPAIARAALAWAHHAAGDDEQAAAWLARALAAAAEDPESGALARREALDLRARLSAGSASD